MNTKYDIENMSDDEMNDLRASLSANPGTARLIDDIAHSAENSVDIELLGSYVASLYAETPAMKQQATASLLDEDIQYIQTMLKHSPEWMASYTKLRAVAEEVQYKPAIDQEPDPVRTNTKKSWFSTFLGSFASGRSAVRYALPLAAAACVLAVVFIASAPAPGDVPMNSLPVLRGSSELYQRLYPQYVSDLEDRDYTAIAATLKTILDKGTPAEQIEAHVYYAEANIQNAHRSFAGLFHWYDKQSLAAAIQACDQALELIEQHSSTLHEQDSKSYSERIFFNKAVGYYLDGNSQESRRMLKKLIEFDGAYTAKALKLQSLVE